MRLQARHQPVLQAIPVFGQVAVLAVGGWLALQGEITVGTFLAFSTYLLQLASPARMLAGVLIVGQQARAGAERVLDLLASNPVVTERPDADDLPPVLGEISFEDVRFGYLSSQPVLDHFDLHIGAGETVALVGASGSGKSTVALLLPRFYDVQSGVVRVDGSNVRDLTLASLRGQIGVVFEESFLFSDTVGANISYGRPDATPAEIEAAARAAEAHDFIMELPSGYDTEVGERGLTLSGGQRQRIALARALLTNPGILILDDATSAIDARVEEEIHATLRRVMRGRTTLLVAHRRSTLRLADRIAVVEGGRVIDQGRHEELFDRCRTYRMLLAGPGDDAEGVGAISIDDPVAEAPLSVEEAIVLDGARRLEDGLVVEDDEELDGDGTVEGVTPSLWGGDDADAPLAGRVPGASGRPLGAGLGPRGGGSVAHRRVVDGCPGRYPRTTRPGGRPPSRPRCRGCGRGGGERGRQIVLAASFCTALPPVSGRRASSWSSSTRWQRWLGPCSFVTASTTVSPRDPKRRCGWPWASFSVVAIVDFFDSVAEVFVTGRTAERLLLALRIRIWSHLQRLSLDYYDREMAGRIMTRMTTDVDACRRSCRAA